MWTERVVVKERFESEVHLKLMGRRGQRGIGPRQVSRLLPNSAGIESRSASVSVRAVAKSRRLRSSARSGEPGSVAHQELHDSGGFGACCRAVGLSRPACHHFRGPVVATLPARPDCGRSTVRARWRRRAVLIGAADNRGYVEHGARPRQHPGVRVLVEPGQADDVPRRVAMPPSIAPCHSPATRRTARQAGTRVRC